MVGGCNTHTLSLWVQDSEELGLREVVGKVDERPRKERLWSSIAGGIPRPMRLEGSLSPMKMPARSPWPPACPREGD